MGPTLISGSRRQGQNGNSTLPPGPSLPQAVQTIGWSLRPMPFMQRCHQRYGDLFTLRIRHAGEWVFLADPEHIKQVFTTDPSTLGAGVANTLLGPVLGPGSVMLMEEPAHITRRRHVLPPFHGQRMLAYGEMIAEIARKEVSQWPVGEPFQLWPRMQTISLEVVMQAVFGTQETPRMTRLRELMKTLTNWMNNPRRLAVLAALGPRWLAGNRSFMSVMGPVEETVLEEVRERRRNDAPDNGDIVSLLNQIRHEDGSPLSEKEMRDELVTLITDGPTSSSMAWAFERLTRHPDKFARLREEVRAGGESPYLDATVKEVLRLIPAVPVVIRKLLKPMQIGGYEIPAGVSVAPCIFLVHYREDIYPHPRSFMPERFLDKPAGTYTWIPFGGGARRCIAANFAQFEMKQVMRTVLEHVELDQPGTRSERARRSAIAFAPDQRGMTVVTRRLAAA
jgi:cytochrome P450